MPTPGVRIASSRARCCAARASSFVEISLEEQPERRAEMIKRSGRHTVPQIFIGERHIGGSDDLYELDAAGQLDALLAG